MRTLLSERYAPITSSIGYLELPLDEAAKGLEQWRRSLNPGLRMSRPGDGFPEVLHRLEPLTGGIRPRELLIEAGKNWSAYFDNSLQGPDAVTTVRHLSRTLQCQGLAIKVVPHTIGLPGIKRGRPGAVQFELLGPLQTDFMNYVRTVAVYWDGSKWVFIAEGTPQWFEDLEAYKARRVRDRFTSEMLERYCKALGLDVFEPSFYGPGSVFFESPTPIPPGAKVMTLKEVQEWLEIIPGMADSLPG